MIQIVSFSSQMARFIKDKSKMESFMAMENSLNQEITIMMVTIRMDSNMEKEY